MSKIQMPLSYYPTTIVLVDDNKNFLQSFKNNLTKEGLNCITFSDPQEALVYLNDVSKRNHIDESFFIALEDPSSHSNIQMNLDFELIYKEVYNPNRFSNVTIVVVDYDMPQIRGDVFCNLLSNHTIKRIMLTGKAEHLKAIQLLNDKTIDNFTEKDPFTGDETVFRQISDLKLEYFNNLFTLVSQYCFPASSYVSHEDYAILVNKVIKQHSIVEHYTFSKSGSKILLDPQGNQFFLLIATEDEMNGYYDIAKYAECSDDLLNKISNKSFMPFLFTNNEKDETPKNWADNLVPIEKIKLGEDFLWYSVCKTNKLDPNKITSYNKMMRDFQPLLEEH